MLAGSEYLAGTMTYRERRTYDHRVECSDEVVIEFAVPEPCASCDAVLPSWHFLRLRNDPKPVRATGVLERAECAQ